MLAEIDISQLWNSNVEMFSVLTGLICVALITFENKSRDLAWWNWPIGIASSAGFVYVFWQYELYFNSLLQVFYVVTGFYGAWAWKHGGKESTELVVNKLKVDDTLMLGVISSLAAFVLMLSADTLNIEFASPFWDAFVVVLSLTAQVLLTRKYYQHWFFWIAVDVIGVYLFASQELYLTALLYIVYGCLCVRGLYTWNQAYKKEGFLSV